MGTVRQVQKEATRRAILEAARACFGEAGYDATTVASVARASGVAAGTVYVHFRSKEELLDTLRDAFNEELVAELQGDLAAGLVEDLPLEGWIERWAGTCLDAWARERGLLRCFVTRAARADSIEAMSDGINPQVARFLTDALSGLAAARGVVLDHPRLVIHGLLGLWTRIGLQHLFHPDVSRAAAIETLTRLTRGALFAVAPELWERPR